MDWQPIETAPKDWRRVLGCIGSGDGRVVVEMEYDRRLGEWHRPMGCGVAITPTHWMPLPGPPSDR